MNIRLIHGTKKFPKKIEYFYDGLASVVDGMIELPSENLHWIKRSWISGYNISPDGERLWNWNQVLQEIDKQLAVKPSKKSAKSVERDANEGTDSGRQPEATDGVRESKSSGSESISE